jgi:hypothetical protein
MAERAAIRIDRLVLLGFGQDAEAGRRLSRLIGLELGRHAVSSNAAIGALEVTVAPVDAAGRARPLEELARIIAADLQRRLG